MVGRTNTIDKNSNRETKGKKEFEDSSGGGMSDCKTKGGRRNTTNDTGTYNARVYIQRGCGG